MNIHKIRKPPIFPKNKADPVGMGQQVVKAWREIFLRFDRLKRSVLHEILQNTQPLQVNLDLSAVLTAQLLERMTVLLDRELMGAGRFGELFWYDAYISEAVLLGTQSVVTNLALQSERYKAERKLSQVVFSQGYFRQVDMAQTASRANWRNLTVQMQSALTQIITDAVIVGDNVKTTAKKIEKALEISQKRARRIAQTDQLMAYRKAEWKEAETAREELGLNAQLLHFSALKETTRKTHAARHGKIFTVENVRAWYEQDGNIYNCYCKQSVVIVNDDGSVDIEPLLKDLKAERAEWLANLEKQKNET